MPQVGFRFYPTEQELLEYYLYNKIIQNPLLYEDGGIPVKDCDLYGSDEPSVIWKLYGGNHLLEGQALYFFTVLKKLSPKATRFNRKIASGAWHGEDGAKAVLACGSDQILGFRKRFLYENDKNPKEDGGWIMHEFTINSSLLGHQYSHQALDFVLCCIKKNESGQQTEKANLGKRKRTSSGQRASSNKRKLNETATCNANDDHDDEGVTRASQEVVSVQQYHSPYEYTTVHTLESEGDMAESVPEDSNPFGIEGFLSSLHKIIEYDGTEDHNDEGVENQQPRAEKGAFCVQQNQAMDSLCSHNVVQIVKFEGEMELLPEESYTFDVEEFLSSLDQIIECECMEDPEYADKCIQSEQLRRFEEEAHLIQQNQPTGSTCSDSIMCIADSEGRMESLPECHTFDVEEFSSILDQILEYVCVEDHDYADECIQSEQPRRSEEEAHLVQQNQPTASTCLNRIMQIVESEGGMESLPDGLTFDVEEFSSSLEQILECVCSEDHDYADECIQSEHLRRSEEEAHLAQQNQPTGSTCSDSIEHIVDSEWGMESLPDCHTFDVEEFSYILDQILENECMKDHDYADECIQSKQLRRSEEEARLVQQNLPTSSTCSNRIMQIVDSEGGMELLPDGHTFDVEEFWSDLDQISEIDCI